MSLPLIKVVGFDPSLRNWGISKGLLSKDLQLQVQDVSIICPVLSTGKQVRQNSLDLEAARQLCKGAIAAAEGAKAIFVEVPIGSQSARAMASYGICIGVLGALRATGIPFFEVTPLEVKMISVGKKNATKLEMIQWATTQHPEANWPTYKRNGVNLVSDAQAEHMADATATIYAGMHTSSFQQVLPFL